jgi:hypothetical protein
VRTRLRAALQLVLDKEGKRSASDDKAPGRPSGSRNGTQEQRVAIERDREERHAKRQAMVRAERLRKPYKQPA